MVEQHVVRIQGGDCHSTAVSAGLRDSGWLPLLEQQALLHCPAATYAPVYAQYALGRGLVLCRYAGSDDGSVAARQIFFDGDDLARLNAARPLRHKALTGDSPDAAPLTAPDALLAGLELIRDRFSESLLSTLMAALFLAARDKRYWVMIEMDGAEAAVSEQGQLMLDTLMRAMPLKDMLRLSYITCGETVSPARCDVRVQPASAHRDAAGGGRVLIDLTRGACDWPGIAPQIDARCLDIARAFMAGDLKALDTLRGEAADRPLVSGEDLAPLKTDGSLSQYFEDWAQGLIRRRGELSDEAYSALAAAQWPRMTARIIEAADTMPRYDYLCQLLRIIESLQHGRRGAVLKVTDRHLSDLSAVLLDSVNWDDIDLTDPDHFRLIRQAMKCVDLIRDAACGEGCLLASRVMGALCGISGTDIRGMLDDLSRLNELQVAIYPSIQACARRYFDRRCALSREGKDEFALADDTLVGAAIIVWTRFEGGIPDFRLLDLARDAVEAAAGEKQSRRFSALLDSMRRRMHRSRQSQPRKREMQIMLGISLGLALIILSVILSYFLFIR